MTHEPGNWGIVAVSMRSPTARTQLEPQGGVFTSVTLGPDGWDPSIVGSIVQVILAPDDTGKTIDAMANPDVKIVSLTITEKGYCTSPATGSLDLAHPDIAHDLANPGNPRSAIGLIAAALDARRLAGRRSFTVLSCDNMPSNGALARASVIKFAAQHDKELANWIANETTFPSTMVDRITPATTQEDIEALAEITGYHDASCVFHEGFRQWVIEDNFVEGRPAWDKAGATFVSCVDAHETMKLRCLNGTHSTLAYLGYLAGYDTIAQTVADPHYAALCKQLWQQEIIPTLQPPDGVDLNAYCADLKTRYQNPAIRHRTWQIGMDGSQKLPQRLLGTIADSLDAGRVPYGLTLAVAGWMRYVGGVDEAGNAIDVRDPLAPALKQATDEASTIKGKVDALLAFDEIFPKALSGDTRFRNLLVQSYETLERSGAKAAVKRMVTS
ncbi:putative D-mannonate oxidoreductase protein [Sulfitobacter noctilucicola]|uniref:Fructuronate reductase n=2 Tax=Sulfitobacter noctilucicola TaxID=1342301 RepID=A0A7W6M6V4_9RHOB|nr:putative D-mannonate oxidoreductase protein [Sulfitobacter noctilucicola]MBB4172566.1 fructuronate reductase [Sulfitobacter noctilucicola]